VSDHRAELAGRIRLEAAGWREIGSPFYGDLGERIADDVERRGPTWTLLEPVATRSYEEAQVLRLLGGVHRIVLGGGAPELARHYASTGGDGDAEAAWRPFLALVAAQPPEVLDAMTRPPQTNEVGRSAALTPGFLTVAAATGFPLRLLEVGSSAGLNLRVDGYRYEQGGAGWGDPSSPVRLTDLWSEGSPPLSVPATIAARRGCDRDPIDASDPESALRLLSYVWPDQHERFAILRAALDVAARMPVTIDRASVDEWLPGQLAAPAVGVATVVFHSVVWQYLPDETRSTIVDSLADAGRRATVDAPVAYLRLEPAPETYVPAQLRLTRWPGPAVADVLLATAGFHLGPVTWLGAGT
jgi:hypothetical protein